MKKIIILYMVTAIAMTGCGGVKQRDSVWDTYDVRYPVPASSSVPVSRARTYDRYSTPGAGYSDNDEFYVPPHGTYMGLCTSSNLGTANCD